MFEFESHGAQQSSFGRRGRRVPGHDHRLPGAHSDLGSSRAGVEWGEASTPTHDGTRPTAPTRGTIRSRTVAVGEGSFNHFSGTVAAGPRLDAVERGAYGNYGRRKRIGKRGLLASAVFPRSGDERNGAGASAPLGAGIKVSAA